jgi:tRNA dimethylallyltransferase
MNAGCAVAHLRCLCLAGPTASGKTATALALAASLERIRPVEIVSVDSALVYRGMDIGTAKPTPVERAQVPHHLIDIVDPAEPYSAARFVADARRLIDEIDARGHLPLLVGGTMLYFKALFDGLDAMPAADSAVRMALSEQAARDGWAELHAELARVDPAAAARIGPADSQRIQRALEVYRVSGIPISAWQTRRAAAAERPPLIALEPGNRAWLHERIAARFAAMLAAGLVDEVRALRQRPGLHAGLPSMRAVGYRQVWEALDAGTLDTLPNHTITSDAPRDRVELDAVALDFVQRTGSAATRQLAKRQMTWLRSMPWRRSIACDEPDAIGRALALAHEIVAAPAPSRPA